jgi:thiamine-monophosphate kinase
MSEFDLIDRLTRLSSDAPPVLTGIGDDAAVTRHEGPTATSVDAVVDGVHFRSDRSSPSQIAGKAIGTALSDLAAMGADPGEIYVTLGFPGGTPRPFLESLADGFAASAARFGVTLAGGDTVGSPVMFLSVTAVGRAPAGEQLVLRSGAREGDLVAVTGEFGGAAAGLLLLDGSGSKSPPDPLPASEPKLPPGPPAAPRSPSAPEPGSPSAPEPGSPSAPLTGQAPTVQTPAGAALAGDVREALILRQLEPSPRLDAGRALRGSGVSAMIDVSDGLAADLGHIARASDVSIEIDRERVPVQTGVEQVAASAGRSGTDLALAGGEDYELDFTFAPEARETVERRIAQVGCRLTLVGKVAPGRDVPGPEVSVRTGGRGEPPPAGFDHFG